MAVFAVSMFKDEADVAEGVVRHMLDEVDGVIVADNLSTDGTLEVLQELAIEDSRLHVVIDEDPAYYQSEKMTRLAHAAGERGATWIVPFDADEIWYAADRISTYLERMPARVDIVEAKLYNHYASSIDDEGDTPFERMVYRHTDVGALPKVAFRRVERFSIRQGNHGVDMDIGRKPISVPGLEIRHFPYRGFEHFKRKAINGAKAYAATDLPVTQGAHWRQYGEILERHGEVALREVYDRWYHFLSPVDAGMVRDPAPYRRWRTA